MNPLTEKPQRTHEQLLRAILEGLCQFRKAIHIRSEIALTELYAVNVPKADGGKVIGKLGRHIRAINLIFGLIGEVQKRAIKVVVDSREETCEPSNPPLSDDEIIALLHDTLERFWPCRFFIERLATTNLLSISVTSAEEMARGYLIVMQMIQSLWNGIGTANGNRNVEIMFA